MRRDRRFVFLVFVLVFLTLSGSLLVSPPASIQRAFAQDGSPVASPLASPNASPLSSPAASPAASPVATGAVNATVFMSGRWRFSIVYAARTESVPELALDG